METNRPNGPGVKPPPVVNSALKSIHISGTDLLWALGELHTYRDEKGEVQEAEVVGMGTVINPNEPGIVQVVIVYPNYKDYFILADHLVIRNLHVSELVIPQAPKLVVPR